jgi:hypothetical protein
MIMHSNSNAVLMLADSRCRELQDEAARLRLARDAYHDDPIVRPVISMACRQLGVTIGRALQQLEPTKWTNLLSIRGAFLR